MHLPTQSANGRPHLTFYDSDDHLSFVWSGSFHDDIEVSAGGYGEPVEQTIPWTESTIARLQTAASPLAVVGAFGDICSDWLAAQP